MEVALRPLEGMGKKGRSEAIVLLVASYLVRFVFRFLNSFSCILSPFVLGFLFWILTSEFWIPKEG